MFFNTEDTEVTEMIFYRHRVYQEKPKGFSQSHAAVWSRSLCAEPLGSSCHLPILSQSENSVTSVSSVLKRKLRT
jgi:hypothetical protein